VLLWGEPGIGKTAALTQLAASLDLPLTTVIASVHEPSDFSGLPVVGDDPAVQRVPMAPPQWAVELVRAGRGLLFLDELSAAGRSASGGAGGVVAAVGARPRRERWEAGWAVLARALETGAPDMLVGPATAPAGLRREDWEVPEAE
jgi:hypothetical protein